MKWKEFVSGKTMDADGNEIKQEANLNSETSNTKLVDLDDMPRMIAAEKEERYQEAEKQAIAAAHRLYLKNRHLPNKLMRTKEYHYYKNSLASDNEMPLFIEAADLGKKELSLFSTWTPGHDVLLILSDWGLRLISTNKGFRAEEYPLSRLQGIYKDDNHYVVQVGSKKIQMRLKKAAELIKLFEQLKIK